MATSSAVSGLVPRLAVSRAESARVRCTCEQGSSGGGGGVGAFSASSAGLRAANSNNFENGKTSAVAAISAAAIAMPMVARLLIAVQTPTEHCEFRDNCCKQAITLTMPKTGRRPRDLCNGDFTTVIDHCRLDPVPEVCFW